MPPFLNRKNMPVDMLVPPQGALEKMRSWVRTYGLSSLASIAHKNHAEILDDKRVQQLMDDLEADFSVPGGKEAGKLWDGVSTFTPVVVRQNSKLGTAGRVFTDDVPHIVGNSFSSKYLTLSLAELENGVRTVVVKPREERQPLRVYEFLRKNSHLQNQEKVIAALSNDGNKILNTVVYKIVDGELEARFVRADNTPEWAKGLLAAAINDVSIVRPNYFRVEMTARYSFRRLLGNVLRRRFAKVFGLRPGVPGISDSRDAAFAMTANVIGEGVDGLYEKPQNIIASYGNRKAVRLI